MYAREPVLPAAQAVGVFYHLLQRHHGEQGYGKLGYNQDAGYSAELVVHRHIVQEEVCQAHKVLAPREHDAQCRGSQEAPLHGTLQDEETQPEEHQYEGSDIDRTAGAWLFTPVLCEASVYGNEFLFGMLHGCLVVC